MEITRRDDAAFLKDWPAFQMMRNSQTTELLISS